MDKDPEKYFYSLLLLFKPFRSELELLGSHKSYAESFDFWKEDLTESALLYHDRLQEMNRARDVLNEQVKKLEEAEKEPNDNNSQNPPNCDPVIDDVVNDVRACIAVEDVSDDDLNRMISGLNVDQLRIFNNVTDILTKHKNNVAGTPVLRKFISGVGGTGKSYLIKLIQLWTKKKLNSDVIIGAPTGLAANNIGGLTLHRLLRLPVEHGSSTSKYTPLSDQALQELRNEFKNVLLFIIDEISMVSNFTLLFIHLRLQEIFNSSEKVDGWFGAICLIVFGDFLQLPPVSKAKKILNYCFMTLKGLEIEKCHASLVSDINLWIDIFSYDELTINVRQQSDTIYADILSRIRLGIMTENDVLTIQTRQMIFKSKDSDARLQELITKFQSLPSDCLCLLATNKQCSQFNTAMSLLPGEEIILNTKDKIDSRTNVQRKQAQECLKKLSEDSSRTAGLEETLTIKIGCKVMLRRNIDSNRGLVNGAIANVIGIIKDATTDEVYKINNRFTKEDYLLERLDVKFEIFTNVYVIRSQFPITLAYGITIHKSQSLSLGSCLMDIGNSVFCDGQTYVALSRVTSLEGLHIINFDPSKVVSNTDAINEYNRLRQAYRPDLEQIKIEKNKNVSRRDSMWWKKDSIEADIFDNEAIENALACLPGFRNQNNNCFANSALQCLLSSKMMNKTIMLGPQSALKDIAVKYKDPTVQILNSDDIITLLGLNLGQQQDPYEFLQHIYEQLFLDKSNIQHKTQFQNALEFTVKETIKCNTNLCPYQAVSEVPDFIYRLTIPFSADRKAVTIKDILQNSFKIAPILGGTCSICAERNLSNSTTILNPKKMLILALNIFVEDDDEVMVLPIPQARRHHKIPLKVNSLPTTPINIDGSLYHIKSVISHVNGDTQYSGHYIAYVKQADGWYKLDDRNVTKCQWPRSSKDAYILFYERK